MVLLSFISLTNLLLELFISSAKMEINHLGIYLFDMRSFKSYYFPNSYPCKSMSSSVRHRAKWYLTLCMKSLFKLRKHFRCRIPFDRPKRRHAFEYILYSGWSRPLCKFSCLLYHISTTLFSFLLSELPFGHSRKYASMARIFLLGGWSSFQRVLLHTMNIIVTIFYLVPHRILGKRNDTGI